MARLFGFSKRADPRGLSPSTARAVELAGRARLAAEVAGRVLHPPDPFRYGRPDGVACELYRESIYWALSAHRELRRGGSEQPVSGSAEVGPSPPEGRVSLDELWDSADPELMARAAGGSDWLAELRSEIAKKTFDALADLPAARQAELAGRLERFSSRLLEPLDDPRREAERIWIRRMIRVVVVVVVVLGVVFVGKGLRGWLELRSDLARHATWTASSKWPVGGCASPAQVCVNSPYYFFSTVEENDPSLVFDLGSVKTLSAIWVENRTECCADRAVPLLVEVSVDNKSWKEVGRRTEPFSTWRHEFSRVHARWVKLHVPRRTFLHLSAVRLLP